MQEIFKEIDSWDEAGFKSAVNLCRWDAYLPWCLAEWVVTHENVMYGPVITPVREGWSVGVTLKSLKEIVVTDPGTARAICLAALEVYKASKEEKDEKDWTP